MDDRCPFCNKAYDFYCHQYCKETEKLKEKLKEGYRKGKVPNLSFKEVEFLIDILEAAYEGSEGI